MEICRTFTICLLKREKKKQRDRDKKEMVTETQRQERDGDRDTETERMRMNLPPNLKAVGCWDSIFLSALWYYWTLKKQPNVPDPLLFNEPHLLFYLEGLNFIP